MKRYLRTLFSKFTRTVPLSSLPFQFRNESVIKTADIPLMFNQLDSALSRNIAKLENELRKPDLEESQVHFLQGRIQEAKNFRSENYLNF